MQPLMLNAPTIIISLMIVALAVLAVRRMMKRGLCDCHDGECPSGGCSGCGAVDKMVADMERAANAQK
ncbi:FeoB-associated Cys-rich membrane protein [Raoultibacter phocaeensis]|uniref:FeoB-associated Cys-rich membrane protein n=1 Tax=Raoultibacter phocaeensis TaxID=2479841 RepID=UPI0011192A1F|nr:FeoB-associated Cys-rich membrane protein [Raoultibacter phocaeensis]